MSMKNPNRMLISEFFCAYHDMSQHECYCPEELLERWDTGNSSSPVPFHSKISFCCGVIQLKECISNVYIIWSSGGSASYNPN